MPAPPATAEPMLSVQHVTKRFVDSPAAAPADERASGPPRRAAVYDLSLEVAAGEIVSLLGPSGCGKTTLLRLVAGLEQPDSGRILCAGVDLTAVPVHQRGFGLMFQEYALFPDKSVAQNVAFGLRMAGWERAATRARVAEMLALVGLQEYAERSIYALSGGERQRVALARSLAPSPRLLMLDEPLASLDRVLREGLLDELRRILKQVGITALYVTHDQQEALAVSDRVALLRAGQLLQVGTPRAVYAAPANAFVARFLGLENLLPATVDASAPQLAQTALGSLPLAAPAQPGAWMLLVRPTALLPGAEGESVALPRLHGRVTHARFRGELVRVQVALRGAGGEAVELSFDLPPGAAPAPGAELTFALDPAACALVAP